MIVVHYTDGTISKGFTNDFFPNKDTFHIKEKDSGETVKVEVSGLKAVFFVKDFEGNKDYRERQDIERTGLGKKIKILFKDGETIIGYTNGYSPNRSGFFIFPSDPQSNNERIFAVNAAAQEITFA